VNVTVPVGLEPPLTVAVSATVAPSVIVVGLAVVAIAGVALFTVTVSFASPQTPALPALFVSPLYVAIHRYVPAASGVKAGAVAEPAASVTAVDVYTSSAGVHDTAALGPYSSNVTVPVGLEPPLTVAVSATVAPSVIVVGLAVVAIVGVAWFTTTDSFAAPQVPATAALFASPL
jgi:hypothetical protein